MTMSEKMITMRQTSCRRKLARPMRLSILVDTRPRGQMHGASAHATLLQSTTASASPVCIGHHVRSPGRSFRDAQAKIALLENRLAESQTQQAALDALYRELAPSRDEWALTEVEQVLLLASQQLQLAGNVSAALAALQLADAKLQRLNRPQ